MTDLSLYLLQKFPQHYPGGNQCSLSLAQSRDMEGHRGTERDRKGKFVSVTHEKYQ